MADNIKINLSIADGAASKAMKDFIDKSSIADNSLKKLGKSGSSTFNEISVGIGKSIGVFDIFAGNLAANIVTGAFNQMTRAASTLFNVLVVDGVSAAQAEEDAINSLNTALALTGIYSKETSADLQAFANALQDTTTAENDVVLQNASLIQSIARLDSEGLKRATKASLELSAALGQDLRTTSEALGRAANGNITILQRMGLNFERGKDNAETFNNALKAIEASFSGAAASKVNTYSGAVTQAKNVFGDFTEVLGFTVIQNAAVINVIKEFSSIMKELTTTTDGQTNTLKRFVAEGLILALQTGSALVAVFDAIGRVLSFVTNSVLVAGNAINVFTAALTGNLEQGTQFLDKLKEDFGDLQSTFSEDTTLSKLGDNIARLHGAAQVGFGAIGTEADNATPKIQNASAAIAQLTEEQKKANKELERFAENLIKQSQSTEDVYNKQLERLRLAKEQQAIVESEADAANYEAKLERERAFNEAELALLEEKQLAQEEKLNEAREKDLITEQEYQTAKAQLRDNYDLEVIKKSQEQAKREKQIRDQQVKYEKDQNERKLKDTATMFGSLASLAAAGGREFFEISKAFNLAEATTAGILAIQKAAASALPPANIPAIVAATAFMGANIARIVSTQPPGYQDGGIVPGTSFSGDRVAARVNSGEMILNREQQTQLFRQANGELSTNGSIGERLDQAISLISQVLAQPLVVEIDGREVFNATRAQLAAGRSF